MAAAHCQFLPAQRIAASLEMLSGRRVPQPSRIVRAITPDDPPPHSPTDSWQTTSWFAPQPPALLRINSPQSPLCGPVPAPTDWDVDPVTRTSTRKVSWSSQAEPRFGATFSDGSDDLASRGRVHSGFSLHSQPSLSRDTTPVQAFPASSYEIADASLRRDVRKQVGFVMSPTHSVHRSEVSVQPYGEVYGAHPRDFEFDRFGNKVPKESPTPIDARDVAPPYRSDSEYSSMRSGTYGTYGGSPPQTFGYHRETFSGQGAYGGYRGGYGNYSDRGGYSNYSGGYAPPQEPLFGGPSYH